MLGEAGVGGAGRSGVGSGGGVACAMRWPTSFASIGAARIWAARRRRRGGEAAALSINAGSLDFGIDTTFFPRLFNVFDVDNGFIGQKTKFMLEYD